MKGLINISAPALTPALYIDVGTEDEQLGQNRAFRDSLAAMRVRYRYQEWPGRHDWDYWRAHVDESLVWLLGEVAPRRRRLPLPW